MSRLSLRERIIIYAGGLLTALGLLYGLWVAPQLERADTLKSQTAAKERQLGELLGLRLQWDTLQRDKSGLDTRLKARGTGFHVGGWLETAAEQAGVRDKMKEVKVSPAAMEGNFRRVAAEVEINGVTLEEVINYLYLIEDPDKMVRVDRLEVRPYPNPLKYDLSLSASSLETPA
jgi:type II secretory pathway component PulM